MKDETLVVCVAILAVTFLECVAILKGIDHGLLGSSFTIIGSLAGYLFGRRKARKEVASPDSK